MCSCLSCILPHCPFIRQALLIWVFITIFLEVCYVNHLIKLVHYNNFQTYWRKVSWEGTPFSSWLYGFITDLSANQSFNSGATSCPFPQISPICCETPGDEGGRLDSSQKVLSDAEKEAELWAFSASWMGIGEAVSSAFTCVLLVSQLWELHADVWISQHLLRAKGSIKQILLPDLVSLVIWSLWCLILTLGPTCSLPECVA